MVRVSISRLKDQLSAYLKMVQGGQTVIVTDRNKPVAQLGPIGPAQSEDEHIARLIAQGVLTPPRSHPPLSLEEIQRRRPVVPGAGVLEALLEERREGR